jgi:hypothetical protein
MTINLFSLLFPMIKKRLDVLNRGLEDNSGDLQEPLHHSDRRQGLDQQLLYMNNYLQNKQAELCSDLQLLSELSSAIAFRAYCRGKQCIYLQISLCASYPISLTHKGNPVFLYRPDAPIIIAMKKALANGKTDCSEWGLTGIEQIVCNLKR